MISALQTTSLADEGRDVPQHVRDSFLTQSRTVSVKRGQIIVSHGIESDDVYLLVGGRVQVTLFSPAGRETIIRDIGEGCIFGELSAFDGEQRSANVVALEDCRLAVMGQAKFCQMIANAPSLSLWMVRHFTAQIRYLTERVYELSTMAVGSRLHCELLRLAVERGVSCDQAVIDPSPTHAELAARIGTNRESVTREMGQLADEGLVFQEGRKLSIPSVNRLGSLVRRLSGTEN